MRIVQRSPRDYWHSWSGQEGEALDCGRVIRHDDRAVTKPAGRPTCQECLTRLRQLAVVSSLRRYIARGRPEPRLNRTVAGWRNRT